MDLIFLLFIPCVLWKMRYCKDGFHGDYLSIKSTQAVRGVMAMLVLFYHLCQKLQGVKVLFFIDNFGIMCVATFFFLSGYGLQKNYMEKPNYRQRILAKRIPAVLVPFLILNLLYWGYYYLTGDPMTLADIMANQAKGVPLVDYSWYMFVILLIYCNYYLSSFLFKPGSWGMVLYHVLSVAAWMLLCEAMGYPFHWYHTVMAFVVGPVWAMAGEKIKERMQQHYWRSLGIALVVFLGFYAAALKTAGLSEVITPLFWASCCAFIPLLLLVLMKFSIGNPILDFWGKISFELYGLQGLFIRLLRSEVCYIENDFLWCAAVIAASMAGGWVLHCLLQKLLTSSKRKKERITT